MNMENNANVRIAANRPAPDIALAINDIPCEGHALTKIAGIEMCHTYNRQYGTRYMAVMPTNLYAPNDNNDLNNSHALPALIGSSYVVMAPSMKLFSPIVKNA